MPACPALVARVLRALLAREASRRGTAATQRRQEGEHAHDTKFAELALSFCFPWAGYFTAEALSLSGIVAILSCGMTMACFTRRVMSASAVTLTSDVYKVGARAPLHTRHALHTRHGTHAAAHTPLHTRHCTHHTGSACAVWPTYGQPSSRALLSALIKSVATQSRSNLISRS